MKKNCCHVTRLLEKYSTVLITAFLCKFINPQKVHDTFIYIYGYKENPRENFWFQDFYYFRNRSFFSEIIFTRESKWDSVATRRWTHMTKAKSPLKILGCKLCLLFPKSLELHSRLRRRKNMFVINSGHTKVEKHEVEVVKGPAGETITISVASTTEHEATLTGIFLHQVLTSSLYRIYYNQA